MIDLGYKGELKKEDLPVRRNDKHDLNLQPSKPEIEIEIRHEIDIHAEPIVVKRRG